MPSLETIFAVSLAGLALSVSPGPSMLYVLSRSVGQSRMAGLASAIGLGLGGVVLAIAAALGLAAVFQNSPFAQTVLKFVGAGYLIYLGVQMALDAVSAAAPPDLSATDPIAATLTNERPPRAGFLHIVWQGVLVEVLNPKTILFFMLFIPPFVEIGGEAEDMMAQLLILGILVPLTAIPSDVFVAFVGGAVADKVKSNPRISLLLGIIGGVVLAGIGLSVLMSR